VKLYVTNEVLWFLAVFYAPIALWLLWKLWRALRANLVVRVLGLAAALAIAIALPLGDVLSTSIKMAELCPQAGLFVKRPVKVEGFYTNFGSPDMLDRGFKYIESRSSGNDLLVYQKGAATLKFDARTYQVKSRYEFIHSEKAGAYQDSKSIGIQKSVVRDRETREELSYALRFYAYPDWLDQNTLGRFGRIVWKCEAHQDQNLLLLRQTLLALD
jgi:hypothetical protein